MKAATVGVAIFLALPIRASAQAPPEWITQDHIALLRRLGIDPVSDVVTKGNYHWKWLSPHPLEVGSYRCPMGSTVSVSRTIVLANPPDGGACHDDRGHTSRFLKIYEDGVVESIDPRE